MIKIFKNRYVIVDSIGIMSGRKYFHCPYWENERRMQINFAYRYTLIEILDRIKRIHDERQKVFRIGYKGKLKRFL